MTDDNELSTKFRLRTERFEHGDFAAEILLPEKPDDLIDESEFNTDERLPYWAELWPSSQALARHLLESQDLPDRALELGAGLALPSLALLHRGVHVVATDYYADALRFARNNAARNELGALETQSLDWRDPVPEPGVFPLIIAADVLYEKRNADSLGGLLPRLLEPGGSLLLADPGRMYQTEFLSRMSDEGWDVQTLEDRFEASPAGNGLKTKVQIFRITRPTAG